MPAQGASYLEVTNNGTAPSVINNISFSYMQVMETPIWETGGPTGACTLGPGATDYITLTGVGVDLAAEGEAFWVTVMGNNGGFAYIIGAFG